MTGLKAFVADVFKHAPTMGALSRLDSWHHINMTSQRTTYSLTTSIWPNDGILQVFDEAGNRILGLALEFLERGGVCDWSYIAFCVQACVEEDGILCETGGQLVDTGSKPVPQRYRYVRSGECARLAACCGADGLMVPVPVREDGLQLSCTPKRGPRLHHKYRGPTQDSCSSTMSASSVSGSSGNQVCRPSKEKRFRDRIEGLAVFLPQQTTCSGWLVFGIRQR